MTMQDQNPRSDGARDEDFAGMHGAEFRRFVRALERVACVDPIFLRGYTITRDVHSGQVVHMISSEDMPYRRLMVPCRNRRGDVCLPCSLLHKGDTFQLVMSGLMGGKGVPKEVATHPSVFVTLAAPSFGAVHRAGDPEKPGNRCHPWADEPTCRHGVPRTCTKRHAYWDADVGTPLCEACYDYVGAVLWNASSGALWHRYTDQVRRMVATHAGVPRTRLGEVVKVAFLKVAEYQRRGMIHFHAVVRFDGPAGPGDDPPDWADVELLRQITEDAAARASVHLPGPPGIGERVMTFGEQATAEPVADGDARRSVSAYVAKYVTKGDVATMVRAKPLAVRSQIEVSALSNFGKRLMYTAWDLGGYPEYARLNLRKWAHQLGFKGNIATKSRTYSTTYKELREARAAFAKAAAGVVEPEAGTTVKESRWRFVGKGLTPAQAEIAAGIADGVVARRGPRPDWIPHPDELA